MPEVKKKKKPVVPKIYKDSAAVDLVPGPEHPVCVRCTMHCGKANPFMRFVGSDNPLVTVVLEGPSQKEDATGLLTSESWNRYTRKAIEGVAEQTGFPVDRIRFAAVTLCAPGKKDNLKTKGSWCRWFLMADLIEHPPVCILPVGTTAAGLLHSKGNTQDWQGRLLHWRGWPDDWISDARFDEGHPILGRPPEPADSCWLVSIKHPRIVQAEATESARVQWLNAIAVALETAADPPAARNYDRPYFDLTFDVDRIEAKLRYLVEHQKTLVSFDTETTGLQPWGPTAKIVLMMFRWDGSSGPDSIAFPWEHATSQLVNEVDRLKPLVLEALYVSRLQGHNLTFDCQFVMARLGADIVRISDAMLRDTWHMHFTLRQIREAMGLETMPHHWCPEWSGYEEDMTLLIDKTVSMQPDKGGHYANCPPEKWDTHLKPYIMGDVEVVHEAAPRIEEALAATKGYRIPLASTKTRGKFRFYTTPDRTFVADRIMAPANRMLTKLMGRGMFVDQAELELQESETPKRIRETKEQVRNADPRIIQWCDSKEATEPEWTFDLDKPATLKELLFDVLGLPNKRLTKGGRAEFGEDPAGWRGIPRAKLLSVAAADKFTLNSMAAEHEELRPLLEFRKTSKLYTTYVRPMRNLFTAGIDKKPRTKPAILMPDGCVHTSFLLCGTRGGRLCVAGDTFIEIRRELWNGTQSVLTPPRPIQMQDLKLSEECATYVMSGRGAWRKVTAVFLKGTEQMFDVRTERGAFVRCTGGHRLDTPTGFQHVRDLAAGSLVKTDTGGNAPISSITPITVLPVWDIEVDVDHSYVAGGFIHHNSSRSPNLQNVAKDGVVKAMYSSRFGKEGAIFQTDLSQVELRLLAAACGDKAMVDAYVRKLDLHSLTCSKLFRIPYEDFSEEKQMWLQDHGQDKLLKEMSLKRRIAKVVNFLTGYGGGALGLQNVLAAQQIYLPIEECEEIIDSFFESYPGLRDHIAYYKNFVLENALAVSLTGRVRLFPEVHSADRQIQSKALRSGYNHLIQTTASDIMLACLIAVEQAMENEGLRSLLVSTVHDSLVIDAKRDELDVIHDICGDVFSNIPEVMRLVYGEDYDTSWMFVPLAGDSVVGNSYLQELKIRPDAATGRVDWDRLLAHAA